MSPQAGHVLQEEVVPRLRSAIPNCVHCVGAEDHEELIQDATAMAAKLLHNVEVQGKTVTPGNIAYYTLQHAKSGRRSTGSSNVDVFGSTTQLNGRSRLSSFEEPAATCEETGVELLQFHDVISNDSEDPSVVAGRKMDWDGLCARLNDRQRCIVMFVVEGKSFRDVAKKYGLSDSTIQTVKRQLANLILEFMGIDILVQVQRAPQWRSNLAASKERAACREERKH